MQPHLRQQRPWLLRSALLLQEAALAAQPWTFHTHTSFCVFSHGSFSTGTSGPVQEKQRGEGGKLATALFAVRPRRIILHDDRNLISLCEIAPGFASHDERRRCSGIPGEASWTGAANPQSGEMSHAGPRIAPLHRFNRL